MYDMYNVVTR